MEDIRTPARARAWSGLLVLALLAVTCGCHRPPPNTSGQPSQRGSPVPVGIAEPYPMATAVAVVPSTESIADTPAAGYIGKQPFLVRCALLWRDPLESYISLVPDVPTTGGRFDPRARRRPEPAFLIWLDLDKVKPGAWRTSSRASTRSADCPIKDACVQVPYATSSGSPGLARRAAIVNTDWSLVLRIDSVVKRKSTSGDMTGISLAGGLILRFKAGPAWLNGRFVAHDTLREDEVAPEQPPVPTPTVPAAQAASPAPTASPR